MRSIGIGLFYAFLSAAIWLTDSAFLSFYNEIPFSGALWAQVTTGRLALRLFIIAMVLIFGLLKIRQYRYENGLTRLFNETRKAEDMYFGNAESRDKSERVLFHCHNLATYFNLSNADKDALRTLCYCYDIGKISLPSSLLQNSARLGKEQADLYDMHTAFGAEIIAAFEDTKDAAPLIMYHHEYFNGGGVYGKKGEEIPLACRIFSVAWAYDSMVNPHHRTRSFICKEALQELRYYEGTAFDPQVVEAFINIMDKPSLLASLSNKEYSLSRSN